MLPVPLLVVSPHLDDAVFSCGVHIAMHASCTVVTLFAGIPESSVNPTDWDHSAGFADGRSAVETRRGEDEQALDALGALPIWLDFLDAQYEREASVDALARAVEAIIERTAPRSVLMPLGLFHSDHVVASDALLPRAKQQGDIAWFAYEDALYRALSGQVQQRLVVLAQRGLVATPAPLPESALAASSKRRAVARYESQLRALDARGISEADIFNPERVWRLTIQP
ncbi:MAG TPA: PIG-L family deacetylase [Burkholderiales bacterium]|nr:PIG-L family deacetylase [Burkholderiales bacterium]